MEESPKNTLKDRLLKQEHDSKKGAFLGRKPKQDDAEKERSDHKEEVVATISKHGISKIFSEDLVGTSDSKREHDENLSEQNSSLSQYTPPPNTEAAGSQSTEERKSIGNIDLSQEQNPELANRVKVGSNTDAMANTEQTDQIQRTSSMDSSAQRRPSQRFAGQRTPIIVENNDETPKTDQMETARSGHHLSYGIYGRKSEDRNKKTNKANSCPCCSIS